MALESARLAVAHGAHDLDGPVAVGAERYFRPGEDRNRAEAPFTTTAQRRPQTGTYSNAFHKLPGAPGNNLPPTA